MSASNNSRYLNQEALRAALTACLFFSNEIKPRNFVESVELQVNMVNGYTRGYSEKRFGGSLALPYCCKPKLRICVICDIQLEEKVKKVLKEYEHGESRQQQQESTTTLPSLTNWEPKGTRFGYCTDADLRKFNKNKKLIKKFCQDWDQFLCSDRIIRMLPRIVGPTLNRLGKFPHVYQDHEDLFDACAERARTIKFMQKKTDSLGAVIGNVKMPVEHLQKNATIAINFWVSLLRRSWLHVQSIYVKSSMSPSQVLFNKQLGGKMVSADKAELMHQLRHKIRSLAPISRQ